MNIFLILIHRLKPVAIERIK